ncbi:MAG: bifunctional diaminohydroxyphosphoribosylaminopyrimidine deaminase/5-amino-6-(5-phosphoribosylamino)uracil reductase RibD [Bacillota bacterium]|nr:bifunctional diaminohydroxyphosphoribosylaminopyrimidine deaminase/5-amino-6-(5-phosphoribosylamino)uracil reductase RibD [Bacillota bacterium]
MKEFYMQRAIELANKGTGFVNPDPLAGAVILRENRIIGEGCHRAYGLDAAEIEALKDAAFQASGAELFMNLDPFLPGGDVHVVSETIIRSGIKKVYIGMESPDIDKSREGIGRLKEAGVEVETGVLAEQCKELNEIYAQYITTGLPFVFTKWAMTLDGKLAARSGDSKWISSEESLKFVHLLRQRVAAIMVGENTVRQDDPLLTTRLEGVRISNPLRVILSKYGDISPEAKVLKVDDMTKTLIAASENIPGDREKMLLSKGVEIIKFKEQKGRIEFKEIVKALGKRKIDSLYIEGGSEVLASAFESGVVNKVYAAVAPKIIGGRDAVTPVGGKGIEKMRDAIVLKKVSHEIVGGDVIFKGYL